MVVYAKDTTKISTIGGEIFDYPMPNEEIGISYQTLHGRGPIKNNYLNTVCHEIYVIISGTAVFTIKGKAFSVEPKDMVIIEPNTPHFIQANHLVYFTITRPNWYESQYKEVA